ncbi:hypothetical protein [Lentzea sp. E54]|uniref:hypothetical protein n=1 Tax=Lentzea xerophila TaxID=3435883 RepID=UPI003DA3D715
MHFAKLEMAVVVSVLLERYDAELVGLPPRPVVNGSIQTPSAPCRIRYRRRATDATPPARRPSRPRAQQ